MRVAVMVISLVLMLLIGLQSCTSAIGSGVSTDAEQKESFGAGAAVGAVVTFLYLLGGAFALGMPRTAMVMFTAAAVIGIAGGSTTEFEDLTVWGIVAGALAVMSFFGWRGKRRSDIRARHDQDAHVQGAVAAGLAAAGVARPPLTAPVPTVARTVECPRCHAVSSETIRFCPECGLQRPA